MKFFLLLVLLIIKLAHAQSDDRFATRLTSKLSISGHQCLGGEVAIAQMSGEWSDYKCSAREWLITVDNLNYCSEEGYCTEIAVGPFIAKLKRSPLKKSEFYIYHKIVPTIPVSPEVRWILRQHWLRVSLNGEIIIVRK